MITLKIEFLGGPLDGHFEALQPPYKEFVGVKTVLAPKSTGLMSDLLRLLSGEKETFPVPFALYKLVYVGPTQPQYRYLGTRLVNDFEHRGEEGLLRESDDIRPPGH